MTSIELNRLFLSLRGDSAFLIGNGINRFANSGCSWTVLLKALSKTFCPSVDFNSIVDGISNTEFFDSLELAILRETPTYDKRDWVKQRINLSLPKVVHEKVFEDLQRLSQQSTIPLNEKALKDSIAQFNSSIATIDFDSAIEFAMTLSALGNKMTPALNSQLTRSIAHLMNNWKPTSIHKNLALFAKKYEFPILTTNYDNLLGSSINARFHDFGHEESSEEHPISCCYTTKRKPSASKFGIWHINGMIKYPKSILIGLTHYMRAMEHIRSCILPLNKFKSELFQGNFGEFSKLANTWVNLIFNKNLFIFGISLEEEEVLLRWLLIERAKFYALFPYYQKKGWYIVSRKDKVSEGKKYFLQTAGIEILYLPDYPDIYKACSV